MRKCSWPVGVLAWSLISSLAPPPRAAECTSAQVEFRYPTRSDLWRGSDILEFDISGQGACDVQNIVVRRITVGYSDEMSIDPSQCERDASLGCAAVRYRCPVYLSPDLQRRRVAVEVCPPSGPCNVGELETRDYAPADAISLQRQNPPPLAVRIRGTPDELRMLQEHPEWIHGTLGNPEGERPIALTTSRVESMEEPGQVYLAIAIDHSWSVDWSVELDQQITQIIDTLTQRTAGRVPVLVNVAKFALTVTSVTNGFTRDRSSILRALGPSFPEGGTNVFGAIIFLVNELRRARRMDAPGARVAAVGILVSDGDHTCGSSCPSETDAANALRLAAEEQVAFHFVQVPGGSSSIAQLTGGEKIPLVNVANLLPDAVIDSVLGRQKITLEPVAPAEATPDEISKLWDRFRKDVDAGIMLTDLYAGIPSATGEQESRVSIVHPAWIPRATRRLQEALDSLGRKQALFAEKTAALTTLGAFLSDPVYIRKEGPRLTTLVVDAFESAVDYALRLVVDDFKARRSELIKAAKDPAAAHRADLERAIQLLNVEIPHLETQVFEWRGKENSANKFRLLKQISRTGPRRDEIDRYFQATFDTVFDLFAAQIMWGYGKNETSDSVLTVLERLERAGFRAAWNSEQFYSATGHTYRSTLDNVVRFLEQEIVLSYTRSIRDGSVAAPNSKGQNATALLRDRFYCLAIHEKMRRLDEEIGTSSLPQKQADFIEKTRALIEKIERIGGPLSPSVAAGSPQGRY